MRQSQPVGSIEPVVDSRVYQIVVRQARHLTRKQPPWRRPAPESLVNSAMIRFLRRRPPRFPSERAMLAYLARTVRNEHIDRVRRSTASCRLPEDRRVDGPIDDLRQSPIEQRIEDLRGALIDLREYDRFAADVISLKFYHRYNDHEVAGILRRRAWEVTSAWRSARSWLRSELADDSRTPRRRRRR